MVDSIEDKMDNDPFIEKYNSKSSSELKSIAASKDSFRLEARIAAISILKNRGDKSEYDKSAIKELRIQQILSNQRKITEENQTTKIIKRLMLIPPGRDSCWSLSPYKRLEIKKFNKNLYRARIEDNYRSYMAPVIICHIKNESTLRFFPFPNLKPILFSSIISFLILAIHSLGIIEIDSYIFATILPLAFTLAIQLLVTPLLFSIIRNELIKTLG